MFHRPGFSFGEPATNGRECLIRQPGRRERGPRRAVGNASRPRPSRLAQGLPRRRRPRPAARHAARHDREPESGRTAQPGPRAGPHGGRTAAPAGVARGTAPLFGPRRSSSARRAGGEWFPGSDFDSRGGQCGAWAMPSRLTAPSARRSVRPAVSARPGETPPRPSGVLAAPLPESGPGGPPARPEAAPPAPRAGHWTRDEQIGSLIRVADRQPDVGFMVRLLALCTLPRRRRRVRGRLRRKARRYGWRWPAVRRGRGR